MRQVRDQVLFATGSKTKSGRVNIDQQKSLPISG